jgi:quercetin 2,3-dioxygenase
MHDELSRRAFLSGAVAATSAGFLHPRERTQESPMLVPPAKKATRVAMNRDTQPRRIERVWKSRPTMEGAGVHLRRAFGNNDVPRLDPFLLLDDFHSTNPDDYRLGFPWHPHRGIETVSYILDGDIEHGDSLGNKGVISTGDVQWMTAGSGIIHQEMPQGDRKGAMWGFQLWANLPASHKMMDPRYQEVKQAQIPVVKTKDGATVLVIAGEVDGTKGPVREIVTDPEFLDVTVPADKTFVHPVKNGHTVFAYVIEGEGHFNGNYSDADAPEGQREGSLVLYGQGDEVAVAATKKPVRFLLAAGKPIKEPVAWYGPIVMNTREELQKAFREYEDGTFVKRGKTR